ncbi:hypothetical protein KIS4809_1212 [Bacillus sp. ZZV12-4809]|nr:hypothetical protein KIS4809_1212 [Bacillus sp. ZZV12-4809]
MSALLREMFSGMPIAGIPMKRRELYPLLLLLNAESYRRKGGETK